MANARAKRSKGSFGRNSCGCGYIIEPRKNIAKGVSVAISADVDTLSNHVNLYSSFSSIFFFDLSVFAAQNITIVGVHPHVLRNFLRHVLWQFLRPVSSHVCWLVLRNKCSFVFPSSNAYK